MTVASKPSTRQSLRRQIVAVAVISAVLLLGLGGWSALAEFSGAVIAQGQMVVDTNAKKIQHPTGGVVSEIRVREGSKVEQGDVLFRLDEIQTRANHAIIVKALDDLTARQAREEAERDDKFSISFPQELLDRMGDPSVARAVNGERLQFSVRRQTRDGLRKQLRERITQLENEVAGHESQIIAKVNQLEWITKELEGVYALWKKNLVQYARVTALEREKERLHGERGQLIAAIAATKAKIAETEIQILQIDQEMRTEVGRDLAEIRGRISELSERKVAVEDQLKRIEVRAPQSGTVHQLSVHTVGAVIAPGEQTMLIVPNTESLSVEARIQPQDIDQLHIGQPAALRFSSFAQRTTPELTGVVSRVSADTSEDTRTGMRFYIARITISAEEVAKLRNANLVPGMPVEAFIQTTPRTVFTFFIKALTDQVAHAFRER